MKKILAAIFAVLLCSSLLVACKKKPVDNSKTFERYFPKAVATSQEKATLTTEIIFGKTDAFYSINFVADDSWTNNLENSKFKFNILANKDVDMDFMVTITSNGNKSVVPLIATVVNGHSSIEFEYSDKLLESTSIKIELTVPGGNGVNGLLFNESNISTAFVWGIESVQFEAEHK